MAVARSAQEKFPLIFEAMKRTLLAYDILQGRLESEINRLTPMVTQNRTIEGLEAADAFVTAMGLVDFAYRFGQLVDALPLLNKKSPELRALRSALAPAETARHYLQHMRGDLNNGNAIDYPILGSLSWARGADCHTLSFSQAGANIPTLVWDREAGSFVADLEYFVKDVHVRPREMSDSMHRTFEWIASKFQFTPSDGGELKWGKTSAYVISVSKEVKNEVGEEFLALNVKGPAGANFRVADEE